MAAVREKKEKKVKKITLQKPRPAKEWEKVLQVPEQIPLQPRTKTIVKKIIHLQLVEDHDGADIHTVALENHMPEQLDVP